MRLRLVSCEIFYREMCLAVSRSPHTVDLEFLPKGLHDIGAASMVERIQRVVDRVDTGAYDAVLLGYGLCNNGLVGLCAKEVPLVVPRAHDCITLFLGSSDRYLSYFNSHPGVYFKTTGWIERGETSGELTQLSVQHQTGMDATYAELVAKYGEDNAKYLYDVLCNQTRNYSQFTFIEMGVEADDSFEEQTRREAEERGWRFEKVMGDLGMIQRLVNGQWADSEFLTVPPGHRIVSDIGGGIVGALETVP